MNSKKKKKEKKIKNNSFIRKIFSWAIFLFVLSFVLSFTFLISISNQKVGEIVKNSNFISPVNSKVYDINGKLITEFFQENRTPIPLSEVPKYLINAFIAIEDSGFYEHYGISIRGIIRAMFENLKENGRIFQGQGGSTITQQLAVNTFLTREDSLSRKIKDALLALQIERTFTKDEILEMYLNLIYFGHGAHGIVSAAKLYFDKPVSELTLAESALLAGIPRRPYFYSPFINLEASLKRKNVILKRMFDLGYINEKEYLESKEEEIILNHNRESEEIAPYFSSYIRTILLDKYGMNMVFKGGLKIYTTLDLELQEKAEEAFLKSGREGALIAIEPHTGFIKAMVGGKNYEESEFNRAIQAYRQPGSAFKPFVYLTALEKGISPSLIIEDAPIVYENGWSPKNYENEFRGPITLREAFEDSVNVVGVKLLEKVGVKEVIQNAYKAGIESNLRPDLSLALGTSEVTPLEMATAYATIANLGIYVKPFAIIKVEDQNGKILEQNQTIKKKVFSEDVCYTLIKLMEGVILRGTGFNAKISRPAAGKTGTTDEFIDAWFVGFTPELVCAVYIGNDDRTPLGNRMTGGVVAAPVWHDFMVSALKDKPATDFPRPDNVKEVVVCAKTGLLPNSNCTKTVKVTFIAGTEPTQICYEGSTIFTENVVSQNTTKDQIPVITGEKKFPLLEEIEILKKEEESEDNSTSHQESKKETLQSLVEELRKRLEQKKDKD
uniref:peptidoglycan glycosyltransferase n=1 Tax=uncultured Atribacterota bacterium TaxID=263865 RepID=G3BMS6_9BACT|nr:membrane carboxypeptidase [uncultured Atribacterota bacterium]